MDRKKVAIVKYEKPYESVEKVVSLCKGLDHLPHNARVFIKPNIVFWTKVTAFPKWGVITTSRVIEDVVIILKEMGVQDITIGEGTITYDPKDRETPAHAFETLGYGTLKKRYGVRVVNVFERFFEKVDFGDGVVLRVNADVLQSDFVVNVPVLKTHAQTVVSLGIKNLKGFLDIDSRRRCHGTDPAKNLHYMISRLPLKLPPTLTLIDGIYSNERGPSFDGRIRRTDILIASSDILSADMVGAKVLGYEPREVPHLVYAAKECNRPLDLSDVEILGERIDEIGLHYEYSFPYTDDDSLPSSLAMMGIKGLYYRKYDLTMCSYCSRINALILPAIARAWKGEPWDEVEVLTGKSMRPSKGKNKTILLGKCMYQANKDHPDIKELIAVKGCPPKLNDIVEAFHKAGIDIDPSLFDDIDKYPGTFMKRYEGKPEFDESFFRVV
ncbi:MAG: DUF362 domain-containing protein [Syntrophales bacterium]|nr:DUF362 domain-containing protein [Syntrophales bacterium]